MGRFSHPDNIVISPLFQLALKEHDEKQLYLARQHLFDIRNVYAVMTDIIQKNIVKVSTVMYTLNI